VAIAALGLIVWLWFNRAQPSSVQPTMEEYTPGTNTFQTITSNDTTVTGIVIRQSSIDQPHDTTNLLIALPRDTTDTMAADTSKKHLDDFIFW
jgi:hypothetical protein